MYSTYFLSRVKYFEKMFFIADIQALAVKYMKGSTAKTLKY